MMIRFRSLIAVSALLLCAACASTPQQSADADYQAPKVYRTGSNIAVKDYGAANIDVVDPKDVKAMIRPPAAKGAVSGN